MWYCHRTVTFYYIYIIRFKTLLLLFSASSFFVSFQGELQLRRSSWFLFCLWLLRIFNEWFCFYIWPFWKALTDRLLCLPALPIRISFSNNRNNFKIPTLKGFGILLKTMESFSFGIGSPFLFASRLDWGVCRRRRLQLFISLHGNELIPYTSMQKIWIYKLFNAIYSIQWLVEINTINSSSAFYGCV